MAVTVDQDEAFCLVRLEGDINITSAAELRKTLIEALESGKDLRLDVAGAAELDITALQLLWAAERKAAGSGTGFTLEGQVPGAISECAANAGFEKFPVPSGPK